MAAPHRKTLNNGPSMHHVRLIDQHGPALACSSQPVFDFVLGDVPDRLARPTGKPASQRGPEVQLVLGAAASTSVSGRRLPQPVFNQRLGAL